MDKNLDERQFRDLLVESDDLQSDAMRGARRDLNAYVEAAQEARYASRRDLRVGGAILGAGALGAAALAFASPAMADSAQDIMALQTAAGLENLAAFTYKTALTLPFTGGSSANGVVKAFSMKTMAQHEEHGKGHGRCGRPRLRGGLLQLEKQEEERRRLLGRHLRWEDLTG